jgi:hypothetical protein
MQNEKIHLERIKRFLARLKELVYSDKTELKASYFYSEEPVPYASLKEQLDKIHPSAGEALGMPGSR